MGERINLFVFTGRKKLDVTQVFLILNYILNVFKFGNIKDNVFFAFPSNEIHGWPKVTQQ